MSVSKKSASYTYTKIEIFTFKLESIPDEEGDLLDGDLLVGGEDNGLYLLVLPQHPDEQLGQVWGGGSIIYDML